MEGKSLKFVVVLLLTTAFLLVFRLLGPGARVLEEGLNITQVIVSVNPSHLGLDFVATYRVPTRKRRRELKTTTTRVLHSREKQCSIQRRLQSFPRKRERPSQRIFFLETSGRSWLTPRQLCSIESAIQFSGLRVTLLLTSPTLDMSENSTCRFFSSLGEQMDVFKLDVSRATEATPLENLVRQGALQNSKWPVTHLSDAVRLALVFKLGGFYSDLDSVTIRSLVHIKNSIGATKINTDPATKHHLANGEFHFQKGHQLLWKTMEDFASKFHGKVREEVGPMLMTNSVKKYLNTETIDHLIEKTKNDLHIFGPQRFYPVLSFEAGRLWPVEPQRFEDWAHLFSDSSMVHFYDSQSKKWSVDNLPAYEAYSVLGPRYCPMAFSLKNF